MTANWGSPNQQLFFFLPLWHSPKPVMIKKSTLVMFLPTWLSRGYTLIYDTTNTFRDLCPNVKDIPGR